MTSFTMNVYSTFILLLQYFAVKIMYYPFFFSPSFYRHSFIPFILRNFYDFHLFFSFTFDFYYYKTISRDFFLQMNFQGIRTDHYTFVDHKMFQNTTCRGFISLAYVAWEFSKCKALEPNTERYFSKWLFLQVCSLHDFSATCEVNSYKTWVEN